MMPTVPAAPVSAASIVVRIVGRLSCLAAAAATKAVTSAATWADTTGHRS